MWCREACPGLRTPDLQSSEVRWTVSSRSQDLLGIKGLSPRLETTKAVRGDMAVGREA